MLEMSLVVKIETQVRKQQCLQPGTGYHDTSIMFPALLPIPCGLKQVTSFAYFIFSMWKRGIIVAYLVKENEAQLTSLNVL